VSGELPFLDETRCDGSAACVAVCPTGCLEMHAGRPWMPRPADCVSCAACVLVCPTHALTMTPSAEVK
jgi:NAD-dependent dihydropyrimidine dehydrogenase PreA subunit